jgi:hypothetical protein
MVFARAGDQLALGNGLYLQNPLKIIPLNRRGSKDLYRYSLLADFRFFGRRGAAQKFLQRDYE